MLIPVAEPTDYTLLWNNLRESISLVKAGEPTPGQGTFNHISGGYDAGTPALASFRFVYSRLTRRRILWVSRSRYLVKCRSRSRLTPSIFDNNGRYTYSLVFAADMYATVFKPDPLDPARGQRYREKILLPGGSQDDIDSLTVCAALPLDWF